MVWNLEIPRLSGKIFGTFVILKNLVSFGKFGKTRNLENCCQTFESNASSVHVVPVQQVEAVLVRALLVPEPVHRNDAVRVEGGKGFADNLDHLKEE